MNLRPDHLLEGGSPLFARADVRSAWAFLQRLDPWVLERQMEVTAIPAPPFHEEARGRRVAELFRECGLQEVRTDDVGNVLGEWGRPGEEEQSSQKREGPFILSAHLDTVFPPGTDVTPRVDGGRIHAPGIADDGRGLAALLALAKVTTNTSLPLPRPLLFVATVGEEGPGNLRGVRHLLAGAEEDPRPAGFISLDGFGLDRIINKGVGSTRLRIVMQGPGGHSWTDYGRPNPIHSLAKVVAGAQALDLPTSPKTTLTVARWGGGTSINSIPQEAWVEVDIRSEGGSELDLLEAELLRLLGGKRLGNGEREGGAEGISVDIEEIGRRPPGSTEETQSLVRAAMEATRILGGDPELMASSTDANIPMSMGIPAITLGAGGGGGGIHTLEEWYHNEQGPEGIFRALLTLLLLD